MYAQHFGLDLPPFELLPDTARFAALPQYRDALDLVEYGIRSGQGVVKVTGEFRFQTNQKKILDLLI